MTEAQIKLLADLRSGAVRLVPVETGYAYVRVKIDTEVKDGWAFVTPPNHTEDVATGHASGEWADGYQFFGNVTTSPDLSASLAEMIEGLVGERDAAERALRTVQNAAKTIASAHGTELQHLRQNASFDHALRAEVESLREHGSEMTDALLASDTRVSELQAENEKLRGDLGKAFGLINVASSYVTAVHYRDEMDKFVDDYRARALAKDHPNGQG